MLKWERYTCEVSVQPVEQIAVNLLYCINAEIASSTFPYLYLSIPVANCQQLTTFRVCYCSRS